MVLIVTWVITYKIHQEASKANMKASIATLLLKDGTLYFGTLLLLDVSQMVIDIVQKRLSSNNTSFVFLIFLPVQIIPSILISRFLIHFRKVNYINEQVDTQRPSFVLSQSLDVSQAYTATLEFGTGLRAPVGHTIQPIMSADILGDITATSVITASIDSREV
ncbi:hypothetical protein AcW1_010242 [Taiwanofungus camphoratus]|nr:hypothetical protein AcW1_010242 [Antrodia cinnamomea]